MIQRILEKNIQAKLFSGKAIIVTGPRQTGKTTLIKTLLKSNAENALLLDGEDPIVQKMLTNVSIEVLKQIAGNYKIIFIDEAQKIENIGVTSKLFIDHVRDKQLILSGSSSFELTQQTHEPLTGRKWSYHLWPISWKEFEQHEGYVKAQQDIENRLVFGLYPDVLNYRAESEKVLHELTDSYLYKDVLMYGGIKKPAEIEKLLQALAYQVGQEVSLRELSEMVSLDPKTIVRYVDILEKAYVIFRLSSFSRNLRNEIKKNNKIYFYDNGVRNAIMGQLQAFSVRQDKGALWENFLISERRKYLDYNNMYAKSYFWRTTQQQEIDYIEEKNSRIYAYEMKWNPRKKVKFSSTFTSQYNAECKVVNSENFRDFVM